MNRDEYVFVAWDNMRKKPSGINVRIVTHSIETFPFPLLESTEATVLENLSKLLRAGNIRNKMYEMIDRCQKHLRFAC